MGVIPGLLQAEGYARAIFESGDPPITPTAWLSSVEARIGRQVLLSRDNGPPFHCIVDEAVLHRPIGGTAVMRAQPARIVDVEAASLP